MNSARSQIKQRIHAEREEQVKWVLPPYGAKRSGLTRKEVGVRINSNADSARRILETLRSRGEASRHIGKGQYRYWKVVPKTKLRCIWCNKEFQVSDFRSRLTAHNGKYGLRCPGSDTVAYPSEPLRVSLRNLTQLLPHLFKN